MLRLSFEIFFNHDTFSIRIVLSGDDLVDSVVPGSAGVYRLELLDSAAFGSAGVYRLLGRLCCTLLI